MRGLAEDLAACAVVGLLLPLGLGGQHRGEQQMPEAELDLRLHRLLFFSDGVYAIAVTLLAVELVRPETARNFTGASCSEASSRAGPGCWPSSPASCSLPTSGRGTTYYSTT